MASDDDEIVQTIKIEVEGEDTAQQALDKIGESANTSFEQLQKAADTAGVSIEQFGQLSQKTQEQYLELSQRVQESSQGIVQATQEVQQAAGAAGGGTRDLGGGLDEVSEKSGVSSREMRGLGKIMKELGAGEAAGLALTFQKVGSSLGGLGVAALAVAMSVGGLAKFIKGVTETTKGLEELSKASGTSVESLKVLEHAFESAGLSSKKFQQAMTEVVGNILREAPKIGDEIADSARRATEAQNAVNKAQAESLDIQRQSAGLAVTDAQASLRSLELKRQLLNHSITKAQYDKQAHIEEKKALETSIQKAKLAIETAEREKALRDSLRGTDDVGAAQRKANEAAANSLGPAIEKYQQLSKGIKETINPLTSQETRTKAIIAVMADLGVAAGEVGANFEKALPAIAKMFDTLSAPEKLKLAEDLKKIGLPEEVINSVKKGSVDFAKAEDAARKYVKAVGELTTAWDKLNKGFQATTVAPKSVASWGEGLENFVKDLKALGAVEHAIIDPIIAAFQSIPEAVDKAIAIVNAAIAAWVTTPVANAWGWVKETWQGIGTWFGTKIEEAKAALTAWVTTPIANAWQWIKDTFYAVLKSLLGKYAPTAGAGGGTVVPGGASGGLFVGRNGGTDTNLAWLTSGEFVMNTAAVGKYGTAMMHAINSLQAPRFAMGGLNIGRPSLGSIGAFGGGLHNVTINFPGLPEITGLRAPSSVVDELRNAAAMAQVRSGGRKPSRYS